MVDAEDDVYITAYESTKVTARGSAIVVTPSLPFLKGSPAIAVQERALWVDHRGAKPVIHTVGVQMVLTPPAELDG